MVWASVGMTCAEPLRIVSYNAENLFYPEQDSINRDTVFTPEGARRWSYTRYYRKEENLAKVLTNIGEWSGVDIVGLQEVECAAVVKRLCYTIRRGVYDFVHYDSPDKRGIDVALVYKKSRVEALSTRAIPVFLNEQTTRDILYACARVDKRDTLHLFVCHMPSQLGGAAESEWKRECAKQVLQTAVDSVFATNEHAKIIVMGDMNSEELKIRGLEDERMKGEGTHKYQGRWSFLDHFYTSLAIDSITNAHIYDAEWLMETDEKYMGLKPKRTYNGLQYNAEGYSDHLPIVLELKIKN